MSNYIYQLEGTRLKHSVTGCFILSCHSVSKDVSMWVGWWWLLTTVPIVDPKIPGKSNLRRERFVLVHSSRVESIMVGSPEGRSLKQLVTLQPRSGHREGDCQFPAHFPLCMLSRIPALEWCPSHLRWTFLSQLT